MSLKNNRHQAIAIYLGNGHYLEEISIYGHMKTCWSLHDAKLFRDTTTCPKGSLPASQSYIFHQAALEDADIQDVENFLDKRCTQYERVIVAASVPETASP